jgi:hypothetical protein
MCWDVNWACLFQNRSQWRSVMTMKFRFHKQQEFLPLLSNRWLTKEHCSMTGKCNWLWSREHKQPCSPRAMSALTLGPRNGPSRARQYHNITKCNSFRVSSHLSCRHTDEWNQHLTIYNGIRVMLSSNLGQDIIYPTEVIRGFPQSLQAHSRKVPQPGYDRFRPSPFQFIIHQTSYHLTIFFPFLLLPLRRTGLISQFHDHF